MSDWDDDEEWVDAELRADACDGISSDSLTPVTAVEVVSRPRKQWVNPYEVILDEVTRTNAYVIILGLEVDRIDTEWGGAHRHRSTRSTLARYERERDRLIAVAAKAISLGIAERHVRIAEKQGELMATQVTRALDVAGITGEQRSLVLREIAAGVRALDRVGA